MIVTGSEARRLEFHPSAAVDAGVLSCEADVFGHYYGNTAAELARTYGCYDEQAAFLVVRAGETVIGMCRLIRPGRLGLKTVADLAAPPWGIDARRSVAAAGIDLDRTWDVATIAVRPKSGAAGRMVAAALFHGLVQVSRANHVEWMTAILDRRARSLMAIQGMELHAFPGTAPAPYLGSSASSPVFARMGTLLERQRQVNSEAYRRTAFGWGLADIVLPRLEQYRLQDDRGPAGLMAPVPGHHGEGHPAGSRRR